jgi:cation/acetate symporter
MSQIQLWTLVFVVLTFGVYIYIAYASRVSSTAGFYIASGGVPAPANGAAIAADWMSAASFISLAGIVAFTGNGYAGSVYLMGWTGGYVLLALLLAPYLRKFGKYTIPDFVGDRYSESARLVAVVAAIVISFVYVAGQMAGVGLVFQRFLGVGTVAGVILGMVIVFFYAVLGGMKGITWTQVAQYSVLIVAYLIPAVAISVQLSGIPVPQIGFGQILAELDGLQRDLGFEAYTAAFTQTNMLNMVLITAALMFGTAGLPHVIVRFYTAKSVRAARYSALWALFFIALLYTSAPAIGAFSKLNFIDQIAGTRIDATPTWFNTWSDVGLITLDDANGNGLIDYGPGATDGAGGRARGGRSPDGGRGASDPPAPGPDRPGDGTNAGGGGAVRSCPWTVHRSRPGRAGGGGGSWVRTSAARNGARDRRSPRAARPPGRSGQRVPRLPKAK